MSVVEKVIKNNKYVFFEWYQNGELHAVYCGPSGEAYSWISARTRLLAYLKEKLAEIDARVKLVQASLEAGTMHIANGNHQ